MMQIMDPTHESGQFPCLECNEVFVDKSSLNTHIVNIHCTEEEIQKLQKESGTYPQVFNFLSNDLDESRMEDESAERVTKLARPLEKEVPSKKSLASILNKVKFFTCHKCRKAFTSKKLWQIHDKEVHKRSRISENYVGTYLLPCTKCDQNFETLRELEIHQASLHPTYICGKCDKGFMDKSQFSVHQKYNCDLMVKEKQTSVPCSRCDKRYPTKEELRSHLAKHPSYTCKCRATFLSLQNLKAHQEKCTIKIKLKSLSCDSCDFTTYEEERMNIHAMTHAYKDTKGSSSEMITCLVCNWVFLKLEDLESHLKSHPFFQCKKCGMKFQSHEDMKVHMNINLCFACMKCGTNFKNERDLAQHKENSHGDYAHYVCDICNFRTESKDKLKLHYKSTSHDVMSFNPTRKDSLQQNDTGLEDKVKNSSKIVKQQNGQPPTGSIPRPMISSQQPGMENNLKQPTNQLNNESIPKGPQKQPFKAIKPKEPRRGFDCSKCGKSFSDEALLRTHQYLHIETSTPSKAWNKSEEKYYTAEELKEFVREPVQKAQRVLQIFNCKKCKAAFPTLEKLNDHCRLHYANFTCALCHFSTDVKHNLTQHHKKDHLISSQKMAKNNDLKGDVSREKIDMTTEQDDTTQVSQDIMEASKGLQKNNISQIASVNQLSEFKGKDGNHLISIGMNEEDNMETENHSKAWHASEEKSAITKEVQESDHINSAPVQKSPTTIKTFNCKRCKAALPSIYKLSQHYKTNHLAPVKEKVMKYDVKGVVLKEENAVKTETAAISSSKQDQDLTRESNGFQGNQYNSQNARINQPSDVRCQDRYVTSISMVEEEKVYKQSPNNPCNISKLSPNSSLEQQVDLPSDVKVQDVDLISISVNEVDKAQEQSQNNFCDTSKLTSDSSLGHQIKLQRDVNGQDSNLITFGGNEVAEDHDHSKNNLCDTPKLSPNSSLEQQVNLSSDVKSQFGALMSISVIKVDEDHMQAQNNKCNTSKLSQNSSLEQHNNLQSDINGQHGKNLMSIGSNEADKSYDNFLNNQGNKSKLSPISSLEQQVNQPSDVKGQIGAITSISVNNVEEDHVQSQNELGKKSIVPQDISPEQQSALKSLIFKCGMCTLEAPSKELLLKHEQWAHKNVCKVCEITFDDPLSLNNHVLESCGQIQCPKCDLRFQQQSALSRHYLNHLTCKTCTKQFSTIEYVEEHEIVCNKVAHGNSLANTVVGDNSPDKTTVDEYSSANKVGNDNCPANTVVDEYSSANIIDNEYNLAIKVVDESSTANTVVNDYNPANTDTKSDETIKCPECDLRFQKRSELKVHYKSHLTCKTCDQSFSSIRAVEKHEIFCNKAVDENSSANTDTEICQQIKCSKCDLRFQQKSDLHAHYKSHFNCKTCDKSFCSVKSAENHEIACTNVVAKISAAVERYERSSESYKQIKCSSCDLRFQHQSALQAHYQSHLTCKICTNRFSSTENVRKHEIVCKKVFNESSPAKRRTESSETIKCPKCDLRFQLQSALKAHYSSHLICNTCNERFSTISSFRHHEIVCNKEVNETSPGKKSEESLETNDNMHNGNSPAKVDTPIHKPVKCPECFLRFHKKSALQAHYSSHMICKTCNQRFSTTASFKNHKIACKKVVEASPAKTSSKSVQGDGKRHTGILNKKKNVYTKVMDRNRPGKSTEKAIDMKTKEQRSKAMEKVKYTCTICPMRLQTTELLLDHHKMCHCNENCICCKACGMTFRNKTHLLLHTTDNWSQQRCAKCSKRFCHKSAFKEHIRKHHIQFKCRTCRKSFPTVASLRAHKHNSCNEKANSERMNSEKEEILTGQLPLNEDETSWQYSELQNTCVEKDLIVPEVPMSTESDETQRAIDQFLKECSSIMTTIAPP